MYYTCDILILKAGFEQSLMAGDLSRDILKAKTLKAKQDSLHICICHMETPLLDASRSKDNR